MPASVTRLALTKPLIAAALAAACATASTTANAATAQDIARLDTDLTPFGAIRAGNADGSIPAWDGGITTPPADYQPGDHHPDPYPGEQPLFTITAENLDQYADRLSAGHQAMLKTYPSFKLPVYPSHRSASAPEWIYQATRESAATAHISDSGNGVSDTINGIPFPLPETGLEVIWNHLLHWRGEQVRRTIAQAAPTRSGKYTLIQFVEDVLFLYHTPGMTTEELDNRIALFKQKVLSPARLAGGLLLVVDTLDQVKEPRKAWLYNTGQRRVRRAPNVAYDNPGTASDGLRTNDQLDMFNGAPDRYDWTLVGRKEMIVPYNAYKLHSDQLSYADILTPLHINPDLTRYELHRVWVVEATLKPGKSHIYKRRTFYFDEDSWQILLEDVYDGRDQLWRVSEGHPINYYEVPALWSTLETHYDLQSGRYIVLGLDNESKTYDFSIKLKPGSFTPAALRREGRR